MPFPSSLGSSHRRQRVAPLARRRHAASERLAVAITIAVGLAAAAASPPVTAQVKPEPDGRWRTTVGAGLTRSTGNTDALAANVTAQAAVATDKGSISLYGTALYGESDGIVSASRYNAGNNLTWELGNRHFVFGTGDWLRDRFQNLNWRTTFSSGLGRHLLKSPADDWDVFAGLAYTHDEYIDRTIVDDRLRADYGRFELALGTDSTHRPTETTTLHQRLVMLPALDGSGSYRVLFNGNLSVSITSRLAMTATLTWSRNSDPGTGVKKNDTLFVTGLTFRID